MSTKINWKKEIENSQFDAKLKLALISYVEKCKHFKVPVIINLRHLSILTGISHKVVKRMVNSSENFYHQFTIPKKSGGIRKIKAPYPTIYHVQKWISTGILSKFLLHSSATAYTKGKSIINHVKPHAGNYSVLVLDLKDFFPSINQKAVKGVFLNIGYPDHIAYFLSKICTLNNELPQGAPSSPVLSNIIGYKIDLQISNYCQKHNITYTRYSDDLCFSSEEDLATNKKDLAKIIEESGFKINETKTRVINGYNKKKIITGLSIGSGKIRLPRKVRRKWRIEIYHIITKGLENHIRVNEISDPIYVNRVIGKLLYWKSVEPENKWVTSSLRKIQRMNAGNNV